MKISDLECVLLVDDDEATNFINKRIVALSDVNVQVEVTCNGQEALDYLTYSGPYKNRDIRQPGIIFLDINMPKMNGWEFLNEYKALPLHKKSKIVISMLTTSMNPDDETKAKEFPEINTFLRKPLTIENIKRLVENFYSQ
jgi:CheY-like chemotaxis protein